tara:strand:- start:217 stop:588 length:372 start_codon:yes stop_codon:yes gene_type:complete
MTYTLIVYHAEQICALLMDKKTVLYNQIIDAHDLEVIMNTYKPSRVIANSNIVAQLLQAQIKISVPNARQYYLVDKNMDLSLHLTTRVRTFAKRIRRLDDRIPGDDFPCLSSGAVSSYFNFEV